MEVIAVEPFTAKAQYGDYYVKLYERFVIISGFGFMKMKNKDGLILHTLEKHLHKKLIQVDDFYKWHCEDFITQEDMTL